MVELKGRHHPPAMGEHKHTEAFRLMKYLDETGTVFELIWNSRDGVTPFIVRAADGTELRHVDWRSDLYAPDYEPAIGQRIFVDMTEARAREIASRGVEHWWDHPEHAAKKSFTTKEELARILFEDVYWRGAPDLVVVTDEVLRGLEERRASESGGGRSGSP